jgi:N-acetylglucosamine kinase-like BadF-type ATPase
MSGAALAAGVDAGGSSVAAVAARAQRIVGRGSAGPANPSALGIEAAAGAIAHAVRAAANGAELGALHVGAAGAGDPAVARGLADALRAHFAGCTVVVEHDARIALRAALPLGDGVVVIAGTGSIAYGERGARTARRGGLGPLLGDEGSAYWIGRAAVRRLARAYDERAPLDALARATAAAFGARSRAALVARARGVPAAEIAALAPVVTAHAAHGDAAAIAIVDAAARLLAALGADVAAALGLAAPHIALGGGLLRDGATVAPRVRAALEALLPACTVVAGAAPEDAALCFARATLAAQTS